MKKLVNLLLGIISFALILSGEYAQAQTAIAQIPSVESLKNVELTDWADEALRSLLELHLYCR